MEVVDRIFFLVLDLLDAGFALVLPIAISIMALVFGWALTRLCFQWLAGNSDNIFGDAIGLFVVLFVFLAIAWSAKGIVDAAGNFAVSVGATISGAEIDPVRLVTPSEQWKIADEQVDLILDVKKKLCTGTWECIKTVPDQLGLELAALFIYAAFAFLIFEMATTAIGYKVNGLFATLFTGFAAAPFTKNMSEGAIQGWQTHLVKLAIIAIVAGIGSRAFELMDLPEVPVLKDIIPAVLLAIFIAWLAWQSRTLAAGVISAVPQLSGQSISRGIGNAVRSVSGGIGMVDHARNLAEREKNHIGANSKAMAGVPGRIGSGIQRLRSGANNNQPPSGTNPGQSNGPTGTRGNGWNGPPTARQQFAAQRLGVDISGMTKGQASATLQGRGAGQSWWSGANAWNAHQGNRINRP